MKTGLASLPRARHWRVFALAMLALLAYPAFVLIAVYSQWLGSGLPGGRNGRPMPTGTALRVPSSPTTCLRVAWIG